MKPAAARPIPTNLLKRRIAVECTFPVAAAATYPVVFTIDRNQPNGKHVMNPTLRKLLGNKDHLGRRYVIFLLGLMLCSLGVACTTKAGLGTTPIAAIPYSLALIMPQLSFGNWLIIFCFAQILVQIMLLGRKCVPSELLIQAILAFVYGYLTDFSMFLLTAVQPELYVSRLVVLVVGCLLLAVGVCLELIGDVGMLSGDAFIKAIAQVTGKSYSGVKIATDSAMTVIAGVLCVVFLGKLVGVREGTVIAAVLVGILLRQCQKLAEKPAKRLLG